MKVETTRFGVLEIEDSSVIRMPRGPLGFEEQKEYCLIQHRPDTSFRWLQSTEEPGLAFVVVDPTEFYADYEIEISDNDAQTLNLTNPEDAMVWAVVSFNKINNDTTANLVAPIVVNKNEMTGMQVILQDDRFSVKQRLVEQKSEVKVKAA